MKRVLFAAVMFAAIFASCKKDDTPAPAVVKPAGQAPVTKTFFLNTPVSISVTGSGGYEYGIKFSVTQNGKITKLGSRMPTAGGYRVTLWDASAAPQTVLSTATVTQGAGALTFQGITPVSLTTGKDYFVSIWSNTNWYYITPIGGGNFGFPITEGSITIKGYQWVSSATANPQKFPVNADNSYVAGLVDFEFQPD
jgi:hypothetical protein